MAPVFELERLDALPVLLPGTRAVEVMMIVVAWPAAFVVANCVENWLRTDVGELDDCAAGIEEGDDVGTPGADELGVLPGPEEDTGVVEVFGGGDDTGFDDGGGGGGVLEVGSAEEEGGGGVLEVLVGSGVLTGAGEADVGVRSLVDEGKADMIL